MNCAFCQDQSIEARMVGENELARAFLNKMPIVPGHVLIIPKRCVASFMELTELEKVAVLDLKLLLRTKLAEKLGAEGFNYAWNEGELAGQTVPHFHLHIVPRKSGDRGVTDYEPRKFLYRPEISREISPEEELADLANFLGST